MIASEREQEPEAEPETDPEVGIHKVIHNNLSRHEDISCVKNWQIITKFVPTEIHDSFTSSYTDAVSWQLVMIYG